MSKEKSTSNGIGFFGLLFLVFLVMKLASIGAMANWSWWWVTSPLWGPTVLFIGGFIVFLLVKGVIALIEAGISKINK